MAAYEVPETASCGQFSSSCHPIKGSKQVSNKESNIFRKDQVKYLKTD